jgi:hypothetical protein
MRVFARDAVLARSKYWYHMKRQHKVRKVQGEIISTSEVSLRKDLSNLCRVLDFRKENRLHQELRNRSQIRNTHKHREHVQGV